MGVHSSYPSHMKNKHAVTQFFCLLSLMTGYYVLKADVTPELANDKDVEENWPCFMTKDLEMFRLCFGRRVLLWKAWNTKVGIPLLVS